MKALFINSSKKQCSIHESGKMIFECLKKSKRCNFDYIEIDEDNCEIPTHYDLYFFNYHHVTMSWFNVDNLKRAIGYVMTTVLEVLPDDPFPRTKHEDFNVFCVIDPTIKSNGKDIFSFPRPLESFSESLPLENSIPIIGSFGFPGESKCFDKVVEAANKEFDRAIVRINMPSADFIDNCDEMRNYWIKACNKAAKDGIEVEITDDFMDKQELIKWCSKNTINCFLYERNSPGLAATVDQAISSGRPLALSDNQTFRHVFQYLDPYPKCSLKEAIRSHPAIIKLIQKDWSQESFAQKFDEMFDMIESDIKVNKLKYSSKNSFNLKKQLRDTKIRRLIDRIKRKFR